MKTKIYSVFIFFIILTLTVNAQKQKQIVVSNVKELLKAISSDTHIKLKKGTYNISNADKTKNPCIKWENVEVIDWGPAGNEPIISRVKNLFIEGEDSAMIVINPRLARVLVFDSCSNIQLKNLIIGHTDGGVCQGSVTDFSNCSNITIDRCILFGSGSEGTVIDGTDNFKFLNSSIQNCSYDLMGINNSSNILFDNDSLQNSGGINHLISIYSSQNVKFDKCIIKGNVNGTITTYLIYVVKSKEVSLDNSSIIDNKVDYFTNYYELDKKTNTFSGNSFGNNK